MNPQAKQKNSPAWWRHIWRHIWRQCLPLLGGLVLLGSLHWQVQEHLLEQSNHQLLKHDQAANMRLSREIFWQRESAKEQESFSKQLIAWTPARTDAIINPLWPFVASFLPEMKAFAKREVNEAGQVQIKDAQSPEGKALFEAGKRFNAKLSLAFLLLFGLGLHFALRWHWLSALNFVALASLGSFLPRGAYFQPEPLSYILTLLAWALAIELLSAKQLRQKKQLIGSALLGLLLGLSWLAKSSAILLLFGFAGMACWQLVRAILMPTPENKQQKNASEQHPEQAQKNKKNQLPAPLQALLALCLLLLTFALTITPRYLYAKEHYGKGLWSYPSAWMWFDHFEPGYDWMVEHSQAKGKGQKLPEPPVKGLGQWLEKHSIQEFSTRLSAGTWQRAQEMLAPKPTRWKKNKPKLPWHELLDYRGRWLAALLGGTLALAAGLAWLRKQRLFSTALFREESQRLAQIKQLCLFALGTLGVWLLSLGWYWPITHSGERFVLIIFALLVYLLFWFIEQMRASSTAQKSLLWQGGFWLVELSLLIFLLLGYGKLLRWPEFS